MVKAFHDGMQGRVQFDGCLSNPFPINRGVKQGCTLAPTLFGIYFALLLQYAFDGSCEDIFLHTRSDGKLLNITRLRSKTKCSTMRLRDFLFADDAAIAAHDVDRLQSMLDCLDAACADFGVQINLAKTVVMAH